MKRTVVGSAAAGACGLATLGLMTLGDMSSSSSAATTLAPTTPASAVGRKVPAPATSATVKVHRVIPKEANGFTQGLEVRKGVLYESVGRYGSSEMRTVNLKTGKVLKRVSLDQKYFAEGMTLLPNGSIVQITWQERTAFVRDPKTLAETAKLTYAQEGWGVCYSSMLKAIIQSDGSGNLYVRDPKTFQELRRIPVTSVGANPPSALNELECEGKSVFANIWTQNTILEIDLQSGAVVREIDATPLAQRQAATDPDDVLNGIASLGKGRYLLTGKRWSSYFEVSFVAR